LKTIDLHEKFSARYLSSENKKIFKNENDSVLNSLSELIQLFYSSSNLLNERTRKSIQELSISNNSSMFTP